MSAWGILGDRNEWKACLVALAIAAPLYVFCVFHHDLWRPAEAREAGIAREMIERGNWVATYLNGYLFLEKPPLYTWTLALSLKLFGLREWAVRVPVLLFTLGTLALTYFLARLRLGTFGAQVSAASLASMWLFMEVNHGAMVDGALAFFVVFAMLSAWFMLRETSGSRRWAVLFYLSLALAFLCKGIVGPLLILVPLAGFVFSSKDWKKLPPLFPRIGIVILGVLVGGWLLALFIKGGTECYRVFFIENHWRRFTGEIGPRAAWFHYLPYLPLAIAPWVLVFPAGAWIAWREWKGKDAEARSFWSFLAWWAGGMLVLLSVSVTKDNQYLLSLLPPAAVVCGTWAEYSIGGGRIPRWAAALMWSFCAVAVLAALALPLAPLFLSGRFSLLSLVALPAFGYVGWRLWPHAARGEWRPVWRWLAGLTVMIGVGLGLFAEPYLNLEKTVKPAAQMIEKALPAGAVLWGYDIGENTEGALYFYGRRTLRIPTVEAVIEKGARREPLFLLLVSRGESHENPERLTNTYEWATLRQTNIGGRVYWLMGNRPAANLCKVKIPRAPDPE